MNKENSVLDFVNYRQLYGHVKRMEDAMLSRRVLNWIPVGRRGTGKFQATWLQDIKKAMKDKVLQERE